MTPFDVIRGRIAAGLRPEGSIEVKQAVSKPVEKRIVKAEANADLRVLDALSERIEAVAGRFEVNRALPNDRRLYGFLKAEYDRLHTEYRKKHQ